MRIAVAGCLTEIPDGHMVDFRENAGNMVHANAPFLIFGNRAHSLADAKRSGYPNIHEFANSACDHVVITVANILKHGAEDGASYLRFRKFLEGFKKPLTIFGLGAQAPLGTDEIKIPQEAIDLLKYLGDRCPSIGVRGRFTEQVVRSTGGVTNTHVIGCPSLFSRSDFDQLLHERLANPVGRPAFAGTHYHMHGEKRLLSEAMKADHFLVEPFNERLYTYYSGLMRGEDVTPPHYMRQFTNIDLAQYCQTRVRFFRTLPQWTSFNREFVRFTYGTRFHVNMASLLSGVPALWIVHDERTKELCELFRLPHITLEEAESLGTDDIPGLLNYDAFCANRHDLTINFVEYLADHGLARNPR